MTFTETERALDAQITELLNARDRFRHIGELQEALTPLSRKQALQTIKEKVAHASHVILALDFLSATPDVAESSHVVEVSHEH